MLGHSTETEVWFWHFTWPHSQAYHAFIHQVYVDSSMWNQKRGEEQGRPEIIIAWVMSSGHKVHIRKWGEAHSRPRSWFSSSSFAPYAWDYMYSACLLVFVVGPHLLLYPPDVIHVVNVSKPALFHHHSFTSVHYWQSKLKNKNWKWGYPLTAVHSNLTTKMISTLTVLYRSYILNNWLNEIPVSLAMSCTIADTRSTLFWFADKWCLCYGLQRSSQSLPYKFQHFEACPEKYLHGNEWVHLGL